MPRVTFTLRPARVKPKVSAKVYLTCGIVTNIRVEGGPPVTVISSSLVDYIDANGLPMEIEVQLLESIKRRLERLAKNYIGRRDYDNTLFIEDLQGLSRCRGYNFNMEEVRPGRIEAGCFYSGTDHDQRDIFFLGMGPDLSLSLSNDRKALMVCKVTSLMAACGITRLFRITRVTAV